MFCNQCEQTAKGTGCTVMGFAASWLGGRSSGPCDLCPAAAGISPACTAPAGPAPKEAESYASIWHPRTLDCLGRAGLWHLPADHNSGSVCWSGRTNLPNPYARSSAGFSSESLAAYPRRACGRIHVSPLLLHLFVPLRPHLLPSLSPPICLPSFMGIFPRHSMHFPLVFSPDTST